MSIELFDGSIVTLTVDAIVNAANATLAGGGGVDGAIQAAAGPELKAAGLAFPQLRPGVRCEVGDAKVTPGFKLNARYVIHTVGPVWRGGDAGEPELLARCYRSVLAEVDRLELSSVAFPADRHWRLRVPSQRGRGDRSARGEGARAPPKREGDLLLSRSRDGSPVRARAQRTLSSAATDEAHPPRRERSAERHCGLKRPPESSVTPPSRSGSPNTSSPLSPPARLLRALRVLNSCGREKGFHPVRNMQSRPPAQRAT